MKFIQKYYLALIIFFLLSNPAMAEKLVFKPIQAPSVTYIFPKNKQKNVFKLGKHQYARRYNSDYHQLYTEQKGKKELWVYRTRDMRPYNPGIIAGKVFRVLIDKKHLRDGSLKLTLKPVSVAEYSRKEGISKFNNIPDFLTSIPPPKFSVKNLLEYLKDNYRNLSIKFNMQVNASPGAVVAKLDRYYKQTSANVGKSFNNYLYINGISEDDVWYYVDGRKTGAVTKLKVSMVLPSKETSAHVIDYRALSEKYRNRFRAALR